MGMYDSTMYYFKLKNGQIILVVNSFWHETPYENFKEFMNEKYGVGNWELNPFVASFHKSKPDYKQDYWEVYNV